MKQGQRVCYFTAAELVENLYRGLADNGFGRLVENVLRSDLIICDEVGFAPLDSTGSQLLFRFVAGAYERRSLAIASPLPLRKSGAVSSPNTAPRPASSIGSCPQHIVATDGESYRMREARSRTAGRPSKR